MTNMRPFLTFLFLALLQLAAAATARSFYFTTSDSTRLYVRVAGKGSPCLFVHGGPGSTAYYFEAMPSARMIEEEIEMIYFDQRGSGRSDSAKTGDYSIPRMIRDMEELRQHLGIRQWMVMGHSFAGILMTHYASAFPTSVNALMYIHCTINMQASMASHLEFGLKELDIKDQRPYRDSTKPLNERVWKIHDLLGQKDIWYKLMYRNAREKKYNDSVTLSVPRFNRAFASGCWSVEEYWKDHTAKTAGIQCPVLVMTGDKDFAVGVDHYRSFRFPKQEVVHYAGGHAPFQEEPQWFAEKVLKFVRGI